MTTSQITSVTRYVVTKLNRDGERTLFDSAQGRYTYATREQAEARADGFRHDRHCANMKLEARAVSCWPVHFDPKEVWFD